MRIIKVSAIGSTNDLLKALVRETNLARATCIIAGEQTQGRGQHGRKWVSEPGKNLICSVFQPVSVVDANMQFYLTMVASLSVHQTLNYFNIPNLSIKWPNDILSGGQKLCGILIENCLQGDLLNGTIFGFGVNINQTLYRNLPNATSMKLVLKKEFDIEEVLDQLLVDFQYFFNKLTEKDHTFLANAYHKYLYRKDSVTAYIHRDKRYLGRIKGVDGQGRLIMEKTGKQLSYYMMNEIKLLYQMDEIITGKL